ncbi:MAG: nitronate monooxygenase family protein [Alphaproteobacteria bacterium]|nr:nitronate monooxygenase family protein [Alphaproteobacteria bacterium]
MPLPAALKGHLSIPAISAPMFLCSGPDLVVETCRSGVIGSFPALNQRTTDGYRDWLLEIGNRLDTLKQQAKDPVAPFAVNLVVHRSNPRLEADLAVTVEHKVPVVITSLGANDKVVEAVHSYGGIVFHDVINLRHAQKTADAGVDGIIAVCSGAGGHASTLSAFALVPEIRQIFDGTIILGGALSTGRHIAVARMLGADMAYIGTRFLATRECLAPEAQKEMICASCAEDILYTPAISGVNGNFLRDSIRAAGLNPDDLTKPDNYNFGTDEIKAWKTVWAAGQGVGSIKDVPGAAELCRRLADEYQAAIAETATWN